MNELAPLPVPESGKHHWPIAANAGLGELLRNFFAGGMATNLAAIDALEANLSSAFAGDASAQVIERSEQWG